jgi:hypothetical protein
VQEKDAWDLKWTVIPIVFFVLIPLVKISWTYFVLGKSVRPNYVWKHFWLGTASLVGLGLPCFILGLDDENDPGRIFHFLWHFFGAVSSYYLNTSVKRTLMLDKKRYREIMKLEKEFVLESKKERSLSVASDFG